MATVPNPSEYYTSKYSGEEIDNAIGQIVEIGGLTAANIPMSADDPTTVATELAGKAPAGFGFGDQAKQFIYTDDSDGSKFVAGIQSFVDGLVSSYQHIIAFQSYPDLPEVAFLGTIVRTGTMVVLLGTNYDGISVQRIYDDSTGWDAWEYVNPPLNLGVEYRTVERYLGKPVYVKLVDLGAMPNNSEKLVEYAGGDATTRTIEAHGVMSGGFVISGCTGLSGYPSQVLDIITTNTQVGAITHTDRSTHTAQFVVKYWRTSD